MYYDIATTTLQCNKPRNSRSPSHIHAYPPLPTQVDSTISNLLHELDLSLLAPRGPEFPLIDEDTLHPTRDVPFTDRAVSNYPPLYYIPNTAP